MKSLILHIEYLLHQSDCVILPGIGAIVAEYVPAIIDQDKGVILPPFRRFSINHSICHDDGILAASISRAERIPMDEARLILRQEISAILEHIEKVGDFNLGRIGLLSINEEKQIILRPRLEGKRLEEATGQHPAILRDEILGEEAREHREIIPVKQEAAPTTAASDADYAESIGLSDLPEDSYVKILSKRNYYIPVNKIFARCAASLIVIAAIALSFIVPDASSSSEKEVKASLNPVETLVSKRQDISEVTPLREKQNESNGKTDTSDADADELFISNPSGYYLIVGTFPSRQEAETFLEARNGGQYPLIAVERNGIWRISAGQGDYSTLRSILNSSEFGAAFAEAWIWNADKQ